MKLADVHQARERISKAIHHTPILHSSTFSKMCGNAIFLKNENFQRTGAFKVRGAYNKIAKLAETSKPEVVVAASAGNHAQGVAYVAAERGITSYIVMPKNTPIAKVTATEGYGANVILDGDNYDDSYEIAQKVVREKNGVFIHPFDDEDVIAGQSTVALEILEDMSDLDAIIVPAGGGGLLAGVAFTAKQINPKIKVFGVQAEGANAIARSFHAKQKVCSESIFTIADGIAVKSPGDITLDYINKYVDDMAVVSDNDIAAAIILLIERSKQIVEPAGATSLAIMLNGTGHELGLSNKKVACVISGGNIDVGFISKIIEKGLVSRGRQMKFSVVLNDRPGSLATFSQVMGNNGANIIAMQYDRMSTELAISETILHIACEVGGVEHGKKVLDAIMKAGYKIIFQ